MEHQDFNTITFGKTKETINKEKKDNNIKSNKQNFSNLDNIVITADKQLGKTIASARTIKGMNQKQLAQESGISVQVLSSWESNKQIPTNAEIAKLEKILGVKLPRNKKKIISD